MAVHAVIMAGGAGTRFWPASRELLPKQFLALGQDKSESLIEATVRRLSPLVSTETTWIATGAHLASITQKMLPNVPKTNILAEPVPRNTAPCVGWATWSIAARDSDALVMVLPSDHAVANEAEFVRLLRVALDAAARGYIGTLGIVPTRPETGYGYIEAGDPIFEGARLAKRFVEKPDRATAEAYAKSGAHLWNGGMFFFRASVMKDAIRTHLPELARVLDAIASQSESDEAVREHFPRAPKISIDHGVMERAERVAVVPGDFGWNDVGSWESAWELARNSEHRSTTE